MNFQTPVALGSTTFSLKGNEYPNDFRRIFWFRDSGEIGSEGYARFWAIVLRFRVSAIDSYRVTEVITLGSYRTPPFLNESGEVDYQTETNPEVKAVTRWQLEETARLKAGLARQTMTALFADDYAQRHGISLEKAFDMAANNKIPQEIKDFAKRKRLFQRKWDDEELQKLGKRREEIMTEQKALGVRLKQNEILADEYGVSVKTIKKRVAQAGQRGFLHDQAGKTKTKRKGTHGKGKKAWQ